MNEDLVNRVSAAGECLVIDVYKSPKADENPVLLVYVHGDGLRTKGARYFQRFFDGMPDIGEKNLILVLLTRPGYSNGRGSSTGQHYYYEGDAYRPRIVASVTRAIIKLKNHYRASKLVVLGHSGGSAILGSGLGTHSDFVPDVAILAACNCNVPAWVAHRNFRSWGTHLTRSPHVLADKVPHKVKVLAITGGADSNAIPSLAKEYIELLKVNRHPNANFVIVSGEGHDGVIESETFFRLLSENL